MAYHLDPRVPGTRLLDCLHRELVVHQAGAVGAVDHLVAAARRHLATDVGGHQAVGHEQDLALRQAFDDGVDVAREVTHTSLAAFTSAELLM